MTLDCAVVEPELLAQRAGPDSRLVSNGLIDAQSIRVLEDLRLDNAVVKCERQQREKRACRGYRSHQDRRPWLLLGRRGRGLDRRRTFCVAGRAWTAGTYPRIRPVLGEFLWLGNGSIVRKYPRS